MKKNLLTLSLVVLSIPTFAQTQNTYIGTKAVVKVQPNTLFYNGGDLSIVDNSDANTDPSDKFIVKNSGNIEVKGNFSNPITPDDDDNKTDNGKVFINEWNGDRDYGQLIINNEKTSTGKVAMERKLPQIDAIDEYIIALPFKGETAENVFKSITNFTLNSQNDSFTGECNVNQNCYTRHQQSMFVWDNAETEYDAVKANTPIDPIQRYLLNTRNGSSLKRFIQDINTNSSATKKSISFAGTPANKTYTINLKSGLKPINGNAFYHEDQKYSQWKNNRNNYAETYDSYLGNQQNNERTNDNKLYGKNLHRLANPYTSNIDLSDLSTDNTWIKFNLSGETDYETTPTGAYQTALRFKVFKVANDFKITWTAEQGNTSDYTTTSNTFFSAHIIPATNVTGKYLWTGSPEALLIRPYETFYIDYYTLNSSVNGSRIIDAKVTLSDSQKTFKKEFPQYRPDDETNGLFSRGTANSNLNALLNDETLKARGLVSDFDFTQLELYLSENNTIKGSAAYLLNANFMTTGNNTANKTANNSVYFYEETVDGQVSTNAETTANEFNSEDYIGKPLRVGFKNLVAGNEYQLNLNLYEYSILNKVNNLSLGRYYLLDKQNNSVVEVDATTQVRFTANENSNNRFEFYWNEEPRTLATIDVNKNATYIYKDKQQQFIRFEDKNTIATVEIFDITGRAIHKVEKVNTSIDHKLNLSNVPNVYVVVITYENGKVVTKKTINK